MTKLHPNAHLMQVAEKDRRCVDGAGSWARTQSGVRCLEHFLRKREDKDWAIW